MGLDISVVKGLQKLADDEVPENYYEHNICHLYNPDGVSKNVETEGYFRYDEINHVTKLGYSYYGKIRSFLSNLLGYNYDELMEDPKKDIPFIELLFFSDCDGCFDSETSSKLYKDFVKYEQSVMDNLNKQVNNFSSLYSEAQEQFFAFLLHPRDIERFYNDFVETYKELKEAFKNASENGAVLFH